MIDFSQPYSKKDFAKFLENFLPEDYKELNETIELPFEAKYFSKIKLLGETNSLNLAVYKVNHSSENDARVGLTREMFRLMAAFGKRKALVILKPKAGDSYRFSLVTIDLKIDDKNKIKRDYSNPKRYSFILGVKAVHTPQKFLVNQGRVTSFEDLQKRFSVEVVNKEFYNQIAVMFSRLVGGKRKQGSRTKNYEHELVLPSTPYENNEQKYKEFAVRLIGRTVFCWFLKKKKSADDIPLIPEDVLSSFAAGFHSGYYHKRVEPLFFNVLNTPVNNRTAEYNNEPYDKIPFLNGGLFEPQPDDYYPNNKPNFALKIPDQWWRDFIDILETYNFTIDENTSIDIDLSVDPEMLGRIFENLLAEINPETGESARKSTGSYYTPRPIVEYMVDESLKQYLATETNINEEKLDVLLDYSREESGLETDEEEKVNEALNNIKVLDPACGSGAFPMGILQKMLLILQKVDHEAANSIEQILADIKDPVSRKILEQKLRDAKVYEDKDLDDYFRKMSIIRRSIFGIDIQPIAVDIAKLRFFLSIIVDAIIEDDKANRGIEPLPNLEFKFVCANTLIPLPPDRQLFENIDSIEKLEELRDMYFISYGDEKKAIKKEFRRVQAQMFNTSIDLLSREPGSHNTAPQTQTQMLATWNPFNNESTKWFDPKWMFGETKGFDVVIGNPPYIVSKGGRYTGKEFSKELIKLFKSTYKTAEQQFNTYTLFLELTGKLLTPKGISYFIVPNTFLANEYSKKLREFLTQDCNIRELFITGMVFDSATVETVVIGYGNSTSKTIKVRHNKESLSILNTEDILSITPDRKLLIKLNKCSLELVKKLNAHPKLNKYAKVWRGLTTGNDKRFITTTPKTQNHKPLITGAEIERYGKLINHKYVEYIPTLLDRARDERIFLLKQKLISKFVGTSLTFTYDSEQQYVLNSGCVTETINSDVEIKYLLALLNSHLLNFYFSNVFTDYRDTFPIMKSGNVELLPVVQTSSSKQTLFISKVENILTAKSSKNNDGASIFETQIDLMVYKLYELSYDEALIVDPEFPGIISREDYEGASIEELAEWEV